MPLGIKPLSDEIKRLIPLSMDWCRSTNRHLPMHGEGRNYRYAHHPLYGDVELPSRASSGGKLRQFRDRCGSCLQDQMMGRATNLVEVIASQGMQDRPLPLLYEARLSGMAALRLVFSGFGVMGGCAYA